MPRWSVTWSRPSRSADRPLGAPAPPADAAVRVRLTGAGALAVALVLASGVVAVNAGNNILYLVVSNLLALLALSGLLGHRNLTAVSLRLLAPDEVWAGRPASVRALLENRRRRPSFLLAVGGGAGVPGAAVAAEVPAGADAGLDLELSFPARGLHPWPGLEVSSVFPFGLIRRGRVLTPPGRVLVYPPPLPVAWEHVERAELAGELVARRAPGVGGDLRGLRDYAPGDGIARVQWSSWLRRRRLQTKEFEAEGAPPVVYAFDAVPGPGTEERLGQLAWLVRAATRRGRSVGLELPGRTIAPGSGPAHRRALLAALALHGVAP